MISQRPMRGEGGGRRGEHRVRVLRNEKKEKKEKQKNLTGSDQANCIYIPPPVLMYSTHVVLFYFLRQNQRGLPPHAKIKLELTLPSTQLIEG